MMQTDFPRTPAPRVDMGRIINDLLAKGEKFQAVRSIMRERFGIQLAYTGHDRVGGKAIARRKRQIDRGQLASVAYCEKCRGQLEEGRTVPLCATCLEDVWR